MRRSVGRIFAKSNKRSVRSIKACPGSGRCHCQSTSFPTQYPAHYRKDCMAEETQPSTDAAAQQQQMQLVLDDRDQRTVYVNGYMFQPSGEEVVLDIGFNLPRPNPQGGQPQVWFKVTDRLIMTYSTAKKLAMSLTQ